MKLSRPWIALFALAACQDVPEVSTPSGTETRDEAIESEPTEPLHAEGVGAPSSVSVVDELTLALPSEDPTIMGEVAPETEPEPEITEVVDTELGRNNTVTLATRSGSTEDRSERDRRTDRPRSVAGGVRGGALHGGGSGGVFAVGRGPGGLAQPAEHQRSGDRFEDYGENDWQRASDDRFATFSIDVDTASYAIARRALNSAVLPQPEGVRVEEFVNVFDYGYAPPESLETPFAIHVEAAESRFGEGLQLLRVGIQGFETDPADRAPANLVFLIDTSGSMRGADRLGLVQYSLNRLLDALGPDDTLSIVTYSGQAETVLSPTRMRDRASIAEAIDRLSAGGSTNGADGIRTAYELAQSVFADGGTNRVIWCTDGDLNVGMTGDDLLAFVEEHGRRGVALTTLGFGRGNLNDRDLERFANRGDGNYHYIDDRNEALRVLGDQMMGTLEVIARDVKIQVEVNPRIVESYRLIGYENRDVADRDFRNDAVDAGEIGSGHSVTALLELDLSESAVVTRTEELATVRVRYEMPDEEGEGREVEQVVYTSELGTSFGHASDSLRLAAAVAEFAEVLRHGENASPDFDAIERIVVGARQDGDLQTEELAALVTQARALWR